MGLKKTRKAMEQAMWVVIAVIVAFVVALIVTTVFSGSTKKAGDQAHTNIETSGAGVNVAVCASLCDSCMSLYGSECPGHNWDDMRPNNCADVTTPCG